MNTTTEADNKINLLAILNSTIYFNNEFTIEKSKILLKSLRIHQTGSQTGSFKTFSLLTKIIPRDKGAF